MAIILFIASVIILIVAEVKVRNIDKYISRVENETNWRLEQNDKLLKENKELRNKNKELEEFINSRKGTYMKMREKTIRQILDENIEYLKDLKNGGMTYEEIGEEFGCSVHTVIRAFKRAKTSGK